MNGITTKRWLMAICLALPACSPQGDAAPAPLDPASQARLREAEQMLLQGVPERVHAHLAALLSRDPVPVQAQYLAGQACYALQEYGEAVRRLDDVLQRARQAYLPRCNSLGFAHYKLGDFDAARATFAAIVAAAPEQPKAHYGLGQVALTEGRFAAAREHLERTLQLDSNHLKARFSLARTLDSMDESEAALAQVELVVERWPSHEEALYLWAGLLSRAGREEEAQAALERRARVYAAKETIGSLGQRIRDGEDSPLLRLQMAEAYLSVGDVQQARGTLEAARQLYPGEPMLQDAWERLVPHD